MGIKLHILVCYLQNALLSTAGVIALGIIMPDRQGDRGRSQEVSSVEPLRQLAVKAPQRTAASVTAMILLGAFPTILPKLQHHFSSICIYLTIIG